MGNAWQIQSKFKFWRESAIQSVLSTSDLMLCRTPQCSQYLQPLSQDPFPTWTTRWPLVDIYSDVPYKNHVE